MREIITEEDLAAFNKGLTGEYREIMNRETRSSAEFLARKRAEEAQANDQEPAPIAPTPTEAVLPE